MNYFYILFFFFLFSKAVCAQATFSAVYRITQTMTGIDGKTSTSLFDGYLYKKGNRSFSYQKPVALDTGSIKTDNNTYEFHMTNTDSVQLLMYIDLDSALFKVYQTNSMMPNRKPSVYCRHFSLEEDQWQLTGETQKIKGFDCTKAILPSRNGGTGNYVEAWVTKDLPNKTGVGFGGVRNVPGVIVKARFIPSYSDIELTNYLVDSPLSDDIFDRKEITTPCGRINQLSEEQIRDNKKRQAILSQ